MVENKEKGEPFLSQTYLVERKEGEGKRKGNLYSLSSLTLPTILGKFLMVFEGKIISPSKLPCMERMEEK